MRTRAFLAIAAVVALAGCATAAPAPPSAPAQTASVAPSQTPEPAQVAESLVIGGLSFSIVFDDESSVEYDYASDPQQAIDALSEALGEDPVVEDVPAARCSSAFTRAAWGGFELRTGFALPPQQQFSVVVTNPVSLPVASSDGSVLGEDNAEFFAAAPDNFKDASGTTSTIRFDVQNLAASGELYNENGPVRSADGDFAWGGTTVARSGAVTVISAPVYFTDC